LATTVETGRGSARRIGRRLFRAFSKAFGYASVAVLVLFAVGGAVGRFKVVPAPERTRGTSYSSNDMVFVVPVPVQRLRVGDVIIVHNAQEKALLRLQQIVDSVGPQVHFAGDPSDRVRRLGGTAWRVSKGVPAAGAVMRLFAGPVQAILQVAFGLLLVVWTEVRRSREPVQPAGQPGPAPA
jgi:hypothetical protein